MAKQEKVKDPMYPEYPEERPLTSSEILVLMRVILLRQKDPRPIPMLADPATHRALRGELLQPFELKFYIERIARWDLVAID